MATLSATIPGARRLRPPVRRRRLEGSARRGPGTACGSASAWRPAFCAFVRSAVPPRVVLRDPSSPPDRVTALSHRL